MSVGKECIPSLALLTWPSGRPHQSPGDDMEMLEQLLQNLSTAYKDCRETPSENVETIDGISVRTEAAKNLARNELYRALKDIQDNLTRMGGVRVTVSEGPTLSVREKLERTETRFLKTTTEVRSGARLLVVDLGMEWVQCANDSTWIGLAVRFAKALGFKDVRANLRW